MLEGARKELLRSSEPGSKLRDEKARLEIQIDRGSSRSGRCALALPVRLLVASLEKEEVIPRETVAALGEAAGPGGVKVREALLERPPRRQGTEPVRLRAVRIQGDGL